MTGQQPIRVWYSGRHARWVMVCRLHHAGQPEPALLMISKFGTAAAAADWGRRHLRSTWHTAQREATR